MVVIISSDSYSVHFDDVVTSVQFKTVRLLVVIDYNICGGDGDCSDGGCGDGGCGGGEILCVAS